MLRFACQGVLIQAILGLLRRLSSIDRPQGHSVLGLLGRCKGVLLLELPADRHLSPQHPQAGSSPMHYEILKYYQSTGKVHIEVLQSLAAPWSRLPVSVCFGMPMKL